MKFVGLLSGGKDSLFAVGKAIAQGHKLVCTANLYNSQELDSFMFQTVGTVMVPAISNSLKVPLVTRELTGKSLCKNLTYSLTQQDEVEDLYELLLEAKLQFPEINAVVSGAVMSEYQRIRVEDVCTRLGLTSISPLWRYNQKELLNQMKQQGYEAAIIKISSMGLQEKHLGSQVSDLIEYFESLHKKFNFNVAGEGGEYETLILDSPIMSKKIILAETEKILTGNSAYSPYGHLIIKKLLLQDKITNAIEEFIPLVKSYPKVFRRHGELFIGEITASNLRVDCVSFEHETFCVLKGLKELIQKEKMDLGNVYYIIAYVKDMKDYQTFNSIYSKFFNFPNPPSRVCCEVSTQDCRLKVSAKATSLKKRCTHVQSISSWAPANIGPYSQAYSINSSLHLAGSIPLVPETMALSSDSLTQIIENCKAVAGINDFSLEDSELCIVYYTNEKNEVPEIYNPLHVQVTGLPRASPLEIEFHLQKNLPNIEKTTEAFDEDNIKFTIIKRHSRELVYLNWYVLIERILDFERFSQIIKSHLENWFETVQHKSGIDKDQLLGSKPIIVKFTDYITEIRIFAPEPYSFNIGWLSDTPVTYINSPTSAIVIQLQDYLQISTYQFINSGN